MLVRLYLEFTRTFLVTKKLSNTAILVFALDASEEVGRKKMPRAKTLFSALNRRTLFEVKKTGLPYVHYDGSHQHGNSFGERFATAIQSLFDKGYENIITIGNDCPQLTATHMLTAASKLEIGQNIVAPSLDGGVNLLGLQKSTFHSETFQILSWQTSILFDEVLEYFERCTEDLVVLESFHDVDSLSDIYSILNKVRSISSELLSLFISLLNNALPYWFNVKNRPHGALVSLPLNKGSPVDLR